MKILITGAGPTGLTAGVELARRGVESEIIDRRSGGSGHSRAVGILPRSLELLGPSGVSEALLAEGIRLQSIQLYRGSRLWAQLSLAGVRPVRHGFGFILGLPQDRTEEILRDAYLGLGGRIRYSTELVDVRQDDNGVVVETAGGDELSCDYLIGADGVHSTVRESIGLEFEGFDLPEPWSIADVEADGLPLDKGTICLCPGGIIVVAIPMEERRYRIAANTASAMAAMPLDIKPTNIRLEGQFSIVVRHTREYGVGRVLLAGDAAHSHSPVGGRGMNLGIANSVELAACIAGDGDLESYRQLRPAQDQKTVAVSEQLRKMFTSSNPVARTLIFTGMKTLSSLRPLQRRFASRMLYD